MKNVVMCDIHGALYRGKEGMNPAQADMAEITNPQNETGTLADVIKGADFFLGVSAAGCLKPEMVETMAKDPVIFAMANPTPEIFPDEAKAAGAAVVGTGRSDYPNQINNVLVFPGLFRGALDVRAKEINGEMKLAAAMAIADYIPAEELSAENIIPKALDRGVANAVAQAVKEAAVKTGVSRK
jgi:malate dehydrogenase (oxaloacetate-decarboxylating)